MNLLLRRAEIAGRCVDVRVRGDRITEIAPSLSSIVGEDAVDADGGALLPGLHDHHLHLLSAAAAADSVQCGPPAVTDAVSLAMSLRAAPGEGWVRGIGYADSVAGSLDRHVLDQLVGDRPARVQHRSGGLWILNSLALQLAGLEHSIEPDVELGADGAPNGRLWRFDARLRAMVGAAEGPSLATIGAQLARYGITGVTDATPDLDPSALALLSSAVHNNELPVDVMLLGAPDGALLPDGMSVGPRKLLLRDHDLPDLDELVATIQQAHCGERAVAVHCVTREALVLTVLALETAGPLPGDRIEHAAVVPSALAARMSALHVSVVTQPSFLALRGDDYLCDVSADDLDCLYPYASLLAAAVPVAASSDAPFGDLDPWRTLAAARDRRTPSGAVIAAHERVDTATALRGFLSPLQQPGERPREVTVGAVADLCLLDASLQDVLSEPDADRVRLVLRRGEPVFAR